MEEIVVDVVSLEVLEGIFVELHCDFTVIALEIGHLCGNEIAVPRMSLQCNSYSLLRLALKIYRGCVEIIDSVSKCIVNQVVYILLVDNVLAVAVLLHGEPHATVAEKGDLIPVARIGTEFHLSGFEGILAIIGDSICHSCLHSFLWCACTCHGNGSGYGSAFTGLLEKFSSVNILIHGVVRLYGESGIRLQ